MVGETRNKKLLHVACYQQCTLSYICFSLNIYFAKKTSNKEENI